MTQTAQLITPDGKKIDLPADLYLQMKGLLDAYQKGKTARTRARMKAAIQTGYGLAADGDSLTKALLQDRSIERSSEDAKLDWFNN